MWFYGMRLLSEDALHARLAAEALRTAVERYAIGRMVDGLEAAIRFAYARRGRRG